MAPEELSLADLDENPIAQFERWLAIAKSGDIRQPVGMTLSTATPLGLPSARIVLLRGVDDRGFTFFTNYDSRKSGELFANPNAALTFWWPELDRQIRIEGTVEQTTDADSDQYWETRPRGSQISAVISDQTTVIQDKSELIARAKTLEVKHSGKDIPRPINWGGWRLRPEMIEFWQEGPFRLHDRFRYSRDGANWIIERLAP